MYFNIIHVQRNFNHFEVDTIQIGAESQIYNEDNPIIKQRSEEV